MRLPKPRRGLLAGLLAFACIVAGVVFIYWPAALIVAGVLLVIDRITS
ncbi:MAG TPA: hypothetical protein VFH56_02165 [Acidimicrobiales bacterium]|nr:hypothetical protein [Acidimicrobiales bacterium]